MSIINISDVPVDGKAYNKKVLISGDDIASFSVVKKYKADQKTVNTFFFIKNNNTYIKILKAELIAYIQNLKFRIIVINTIKEFCPFFTSLVEAIDKDIFIFRDRTSGELIYTFKEDCIKSRLIKGHMQSGKTWTIIAIVLYYYLVYRISSFVLIQNAIDALEQFFSRLSDIRNKYEAKFRETKSLIIDYQRGREIMDESIIEAVSTNKSCIFVSLKSGSDIDPIINALEHAEYKRVLCVCDEADFLDSGATSASQSSVTVLKQLVNSVWNITATPISSLMKEEICVANLHLMPKPAKYRSVSDFKFKPIEGTYCVKKDHDPFLCISELKTYIDTFSTVKHYKLGQHHTHPVVSLVRVSSIVETIIALSKYVKTNFNNEIAVLTYNGGDHGITLSHGSLNDAPIPYLGTGKYFFADGVHKFVGCHISTIMDFLRDKGTDVFPRIMIIAGKKADRGITFTSSYDKYISKKQLPWHLTEMFATVSKSTPQAGVLQLIGRLCGIYYDNIPLTVYSNANEDVLKAFYVQEELLERSLENNQQDIIRDIIPRTPISKNKCSIRRITNPKVSCRLYKISDDYGYGGWDWTYDGSRIITSNMELNDKNNKNKTEEEIKELRKNGNNVSKNQPSFVDGKSTKYIHEKDLAEVSRNLFNHLYTSLEKDNNEKWIQASMYYRKEDGKRDRQNMWHLYDKAKTTFTLRDRVLMINKDNDRFWIRL